MTPSNMLTIEQLLDVAEECFEEHHDQVLQWLNSSVSFERWLIAQFVSACRSAGLTALNEIGYATFGLPGISNSALPSRDSADMAIISLVTGEMWLFEAAVILPQTQKKWQNKIRQDADKLRRVKGGVSRKFLLLFCASAVENVVGDGHDGAWDGWFEKIRSYCTVAKWPENHSSVRYVGLGSGQLALRIWEVSEQPAFK